MLQRLGIRGKILAVVAVPILVLVIAAGAFTFTAARGLDGANNVKQLLDVVRVSHNLVDNLQAERALASNYVHSYQTATLLQDRAANDVDSAIRNALTLAAQSTGSNAEDFQAASERVLEVTGLQTTVGTDGVVNILPQPNNPEPGTLYDLRSRVVVEVNGTDWPAWPSEAEIAEYTSEYAQVRTDLAAVLEGLPQNSEFVAELQDAVEAMGTEASQAIDALTVPATYEDSLENTFEAVDDALVAFSETAAGISQRDSNSGVVELANAVEGRLAGLETTRGPIYRLIANPRALEIDYGRSIQDLNAIPEQVVLSVDDLRLIEELNAFSDLDTLIEQLQVERLGSERVIRQEFFYPGELNAMRRQVVVTDIALESARTAVAPLELEQELPDFGADGPDGLQSSFVLIRNRLQLGTDIAVTNQQSRRWPEQVEREIAQYAPTRDQIWRDALNRSDSLQRERLTATVVTALIAAAVVAGSLFIALLIARRIVGPLRRLTTTATAVRQELPRLVERVALPGQTVDVSEVQIPVESSDEIGRLAEAFNSVNAATLSIAGEQAALRGSISEMFVNVARRDQVLLNRQLASIDEMERTQDDADTLQKLFALDHLATRMRRNSESLLVLAGIDTGRRMRRPMPLSDVVRTASSEIELYERIQLELDADPSMVGHSALTAAHLFAELLENATVFSDPGSPVTVRTSRRDGSYVVEIIDEGIGMAPDELQEANGRVLSTAASEILGAQRLGLFVVGRIARRIGARVELESKEGAGTTARVILPMSLFDASTSGDDSHVSGSAVDADMAVPAALVSHSEADEELDAADNPLAPPPADEIPDESTPLPLDPPAVTSDADPAPIGWAGSSAAYEASDQPTEPESVPSPDVLPSRPLDSSGPSAWDANEVPEPPAEAPDAAPQAPAPAPSFGLPDPGPQDAPPRAWGFSVPEADGEFDDSPIPVPDVPHEAEVTTADINQLIEADAESAPEAEEVDIDSLRGGTTASGLPARRRSPEPGSEAPVETTSVLGLPPRPSTGQIDELSASAQSGFVPKVSASEVAPQTAEQRASMFRGFQNTRTEEAPKDEGSVPESYGFATRRSSIAPDAIPALEDEDSEDR